MSSIRSSRSRSEDGVPPLWPGIDREAWVRDFAAARDDLARQEQAGEEPVIDPYAADSPAEGFAVFSEVFFETPLVLAQEYPAVYRHLCAFYRQEPGGAR